jgi:hypothetical protein
MGVDVAARFRVYGQAQRAEGVWGLGFGVQDSGIRSGV